MRFRKPTVEPLEINLTPMIDCLLFLIVFLLLSTTFNHFSKLNIILPQAEGVPITEKSKRIEIAVQKDGSYLVNGIALSGNGEAELTAMIRQERVKTESSYLLSLLMPIPVTNRWLK